MLHSAGAQKVQYLNAAQLISSTDPSQTHKTQSQQTH